MSLAAGRVASGAAGLSWQCRCSCHKSCPRHEMPNTRTFKCLHSTFTGLSHVFSPWQRCRRGLTRRSLPSKVNSECTCTFLGRARDTAEGEGMLSPHLAFTTDKEQLQGGVQECEIWAQARLVSLLQKPQQQAPVEADVCRLQPGLVYNTLANAC
jgi:hypothetical protein